MSKRATIVTEDGVMADVVIDGNSFSIVDGSLRKSAEAQRLAEALARIDGTDTGPLARAFDVAGSRPGTRLDLGAPETDGDPLTKGSEARKGETLDEAWNRVTRNPSNQRRG